MQLSAASAPLKVKRMDPILWNRMSRRARRDVRLARELQRRGEDVRLFPALCKWADTESKRAEVDHA